MALPEDVVRAWLADVRVKLAEHVDHVMSPAGDRVTVAYLNDRDGRQWARLHGFAERPGHGVERIEVELAPGVVVELLECRVYPD